MKAGYWINVRTEKWYEIDDHAAWLRRPECARLAGLPEEAAHCIRNMAYRTVDGPDRHAILYAGFREGLARVRGHGDYVTIESTLGLMDLLPALASVMAHHFGPLTWVKIHCLPEGPFVALSYQDLTAALDRGELATLVPQPCPPRASTEAP